jgi:hypothetical protein
MDLGIGGSGAVASVCFSAIVALGTGDLHTLLLKLVPSYLCIGALKLATSRNKLCCEPLPLHNPLTLQSDGPDELAWILEAKLHELIMLGTCF